jgi:peptidyl-prolyl cis-trans isomerase SurA
MADHLQSKVLNHMRKAAAWNDNGRYLLFVLLAALTVLAVWPCLAENEDTSEKIVDRVVAVVNNDIILLSDVEKALAPYIKNIRERHLPGPTEAQVLSRAREEILDNLINEKLATQRASALGLAVDDGEVDAALEEMKKSMLYSDESFRAFLSESGYSLDEYREQIKNQILKSKLLRQEIRSKTVVTTEEIADYYQGRQDEFSQGTLYHLKHIIMLAPAETDAAERAAVRTKMEEIYQSLKGGAPFEALAIQYSQSSFAKDGGDLGRFAEDDLAPELKEAITTTEEGDITPIIETKLGYQIFYVASIIKNEGGLDSDLSEKIREKLYNDKMDEKFKLWIKSLRDSAHIKIIGTAPPD